MSNLLVRIWLSYFPAGNISHHLVTVSHHLQRDSFRAGVCYFGAFTKVEVLRKSLIRVIH
jgi:hypothetical protein